MQNIDFNTQAKNSNRFIYFYRIFILLILGIFLSLSIVFTVKNKFDWQNLFLIIIFIIAFLFCFIIYFFKPLFKFKNKKNEMISYFINNGFVIKDFKWNKKVVVIKGNSVFLFVEKNFNISKYENVCKQLDYNLIASNNFFITQELLNLGNEIFDSQSLIKTIKILNEDI